MAATYEPIETYTLTSTASSITFGSSGTLSQAYTDLIVVSYVNSNRSAQYDSLAVRFNADSGSNYSYNLLQGSTSNGSNTVAGRATSQSNIFIGNIIASSATNNFSTNILHIMNYTNATTYKTAISRGGAIVDAGNNDEEIVTGLWRATAQAITSVTIRNETGSLFNIGSVFSIYGIKAI